MPSIRGASSAGTWQAATTLAVPAGVQDGDVLIAWLSANDQAAVTPPSEWDLLASDVGGDIGDNTGVYLYTRVASSEPAEYTWTWAGEHWHHGLMVAVAGAEGIRSHALAAAEGVTAVDAPSVEAVASDLAVVFGYHWGTDPGTEPAFDGLDEVIAQASILCAALDPIETTGPTEAYPCTSAAVGRMAAAVVVFSAPPPAPEPVWQPIPERQPLPPASEWRYRAFNILTGAVVDPDLPLEDAKITLTLSGPCGITATIDPEHPELYDDSGRLVFVEWQTLLVAEAAGQIRGAGLVTKVDDAGQKLSISATGVSGYPEGQTIRTTLTWGGKTDGLTGAGVDPLDVVRSIWTQLQDQPDGDLGVLVDETTTPYRLGEWRGGIRRLNEDGSLGPAKEVDGQPVPIDRIWDPKTDRKPVAATGKTVYWQYQIPWWDDVDAGQRITQLGTQAQFEYAEEYRWTNADRTALTKRIRLGYPRLGRRSDRAFVEDENIVDLVVVRRDGDDYANAVTVNGAGEGSKKVRGSASTRDGRARRSKTLDRPDLTTAAACKAAAEEELRKWSQITDITGFAVIDHPNAPLGSFAPGDDVLVETTGRRWLPTRLWVRITDMTTTPGSDEIAVTCRRSDRFSYPGGV